MGILKYDTIDTDTHRNTNKNMFRILVEYLIE